MDMTNLPLGKGPLIADIKAIDRRLEKLHEERVRATVQRRDKAGCRAQGVHADCWGDLTVAHMEGHRRHQTRGLPPEERHDSAWELALCSRHHDLEERHVIAVVYLTPHECNGAVGWTVAA